MVRLVGRDGRMVRLASTLTMLRRYHIILARINRLLALPFWMNIGYNLASFIPRIV